MSDAYTENRSETCSQSYGLDSRTDRWSGSGAVVFTGCVLRRWGIQVRMLAAASESEGGR